MSTIGEQIYEPEGCPDNFMAQLESAVRYEIHYTDRISGQEWAPLTLFRTKQGAINNATARLKQDVTIKSFRIVAVDFCPNATK